MIIELDDDLREIISREPRAYGLLLTIPREKWSELYSGLRDYVRWLLERRGSQKKISRFEKELSNIEESARSKVDSSEWSEDQAAQKKADWIWWQAVEESQNGALYTAFVEVGQSSSKDEKTFEEARDEVEREMVRKLRQLLNISEP